MFFFKEKILYVGVYRKNPNNVETWTTECKFQYILPNHTPVLWRKLVIFYQKCLI